MLAENCAGKPVLAWMSAGAGTRFVEHDPVRTHVRRERADVRAVRVCAAVERGGEEQASETRNVDANERDENRLDDDQRGVVAVQFAVAPCVVRKEPADALSRQRR
ncbi:hypothetical protein GCM10010985_55290 [Caballeronia grimmiae]|nr:hypothetical protein GCM10010985_55290 [Caballeronia grimmiae]